MTDDVKVIRRDGRLALKVFRRCDFCGAPWHVSIETSSTILDQVECELHACRACDRARTFLPRYLQGDLKEVAAMVARLGGNGA